MFRKIISGIVVAAFSLLTLVPPGRAQIAPTVLNLPAPGSVVSLTPAFTPTLVKGMTLHPQNPLAFDFIVDTGDTGVKGDGLKEESTKLIKYFLAGLTVPESEMWVNLSPYEKDRVIPSRFGATEMGRDLLAQDYLLKQLTASLMYPENDLGAAFWERVYAKAQERFGTTDIPTDTFNKVWIMPDSAVVYEEGPSVFILKSHLKVLLEEDYLARSSSLVARGQQELSANSQELTPITSIVREILIPEIEKEINEGKTFANLRQIYNSVILAAWYKKNLKESLLGQAYVDRNKTKGVDHEDKEINEKIYAQYLAAFKKGIFDYIKEDYDPVTQEVVERKYFSGGSHLKVDSVLMSVTPQTIGKHPDLTLLANTVRESQNTVKVLCDLLPSTAGNTTLVQNAAVNTDPEMATEDEQVDIDNAGEKLERTTGPFADELARELGGIVKKLQRLHLDRNFPSIKKDAAMLNRKNIATILICLLVVGASVLGGSFIGEMLSYKQGDPGSSISIQDEKGFTEIIVKQLKSFSDLLDMLGTPQAEEILEKYEKNLDALHSTDWTNNDTVSPEVVEALNQLAAKILGIEGEGVDVYNLPPSTYTVSLAVGIARELLNSLESWQGVLSASRTEFESHQESLRKDFLYWKAKLELSGAEEVSSADKQKLEGMADIFIKVTDISRAGLVDRRKLGFSLLGLDSYVEEIGRLLKNIKSILAESKNWEDTERAGELFQEVLKGLNYSNKEIAYFMGDPAMMGEVSVEELAGELERLHVLEDLAPVFKDAAMLGKMGKWQDKFFEFVDEAFSDRRGPITGAIILSVSFGLITFGALENYKNSTEPLVVVQEKLKKDMDGWNLVLQELGTPQAEETLKELKEKIASFRRDNEDQLFPRREAFVSFTRMIGDMLKLESPALEQVIPPITNESISAIFDILERTVKALETRHFLLRDLRSDWNLYMKVEGFKKGLEDLRGVSELRDGQPVSAEQVDSINKLFELFSQYAARLNEFKVPADLVGFSQYKEEFVGSLRGVVVAGEGITPSMARNEPEGVAMDAVMAREKIREFLGKLNFTVEEIHADMGDPAMMVTEHEKALDKKGNVKTGVRLSLEVFEELVRHGKISQDKYMLMSMRKQGLYGYVQGGQFLEIEDTGEGKMIVFKESDPLDLSPPDFSNNLIIPWRDVQHIEMVPDVIRTLEDALIGKDKKVITEVPIHTKVFQELVKTGKVRKGLPLELVFLSKAPDVNSQTNGFFKGIERYNNTFWIIFKGGKGLPLNHNIVAVIIHAADKALLVPKEVSREMSPSVNPPAVNPIGGIDMNSSKINWVFERDEKGQFLPAAQQPVEVFDVPGFFPWIRVITPVTAPLFSAVRVPPADADAAGPVLPLEKRDMPVDRVTFKQS